ncbi:MAG: protein-L-isoaspartate(D-aspartate) O-methyltransferase [Pseudomonadota bacterium]
MAFVLLFLFAMSGGPPYEALRNQMVEHQLAARDVHSQAVLNAMRRVPRHLFVPEGDRGEAYEDHPLLIGDGQTISQPYIVAKMTELAEVGRGSKVLEVGTGSGYQAAVLAEMGADVYSIEILDSLSKRAGENLKASHYSAHLRTGDGYRGWPEEAPFDAIIVTAAPEKIPEPLKDQLKIGGRLVIPVGPASGFFSHQDLRVVTRKTKTEYVSRDVLPVVFVPMTGEALKK